MIALTKVHETVLLVMDEVDEMLRTKSDFKTFVKENLPSQAALVTEADVAVDELLRKRLSAVFPEVGFLTEEKESDLKDFNWVIDPIDGTSNFARGLPFFGVSVGLWKGMEPVYGMVSLPKLGERVWATKGGGCLVNGAPLERSVISNPKPYLLLAPVGSGDVVGKVVTLLGEEIGHPRDFGCCVYQIVQTIFGKADLMVGLNLSVWDFGAGWLLATEAGLAFELLSQFPAALSETTDYAHTFVMGKQDMVERGAQVLKGI